VHQLPFHDTQQQNINIINISPWRVDDFETVMENSIKHPQMISLKYTNHQIKVEKIPESCHYDIFLPCGIKLNFTHERDQYSANGISYNRLSTKIFITYSLHAEVRKDVVNRIAKYSDHIWWNWPSSKKINDMHKFISSM